MPIRLKDFTDVLRNLRRGKGSQKFCPVCKGSQLELISALGIGLTPTQYVCKKCGYRGTLFMELEEEPRKKVR